MDTENGSRRLPRFLVSAWVLAVVAGVVFAAGFRSSSGEAYELHGFRWQKPIVGYSVEDPRVEAYVTASMRLWGEPSLLRLAPGGSDIRIVVAPLLPPIHYDGQPAQANVDHQAGWIEGCEVRLDPIHFFNLNEPTRQAVLTHELGHCIGLDHSKAPSIMQSPYLYSFSEDDVAAVRNLYGVPQPVSLGSRLTVPDLAAGP